MAKAPTTKGTPEESGGGPPPTDLYAVTDIRIVMRELGKLGAQVERLIEDVASHSGKLDDVRHKITFVRGAMWVVGGFVAALLLAAGWLITHVSIALSH